MKVLEECASHLTNREVFEVLRDRGAGDAESVNVHSSERKVYEYLKKKTTESPEGCLHAFLETTKEMNMRKLEALQLVNLRPSLPIDVFLAVDQCEERLGEENVEKVLEVARRAFPKPTESHS